MNHLDELYESIAEFVENYRQKPDKISIRKDIYDEIEKSELPDIEIEIKEQDIKHELDRLKNKNSKFELIGDISGFFIIEYIGIDHPLCSKSTTMVQPEVIETILKMLMDNKKCQKQST